jgi:hypothetical protein
MFVRWIRFLVAAAVVISATGCSQVRLLPKADAMREGELEEATVRTRTGEVYFFEHVQVSADSLSGYAQERRTVYLPEGEIREVTEEREVLLALEDVEQITVVKRDWKRAGMWALIVGGVAGGLAITAGQSSGDDNASGGGDGRPIKPEDGK